MDDPFAVLDCALRSRYVAPEALPALPVWERLPSELRTGLTHALAAGQSLAEVVPLVWRVRAELHGKPEPDESGERTRATAALRLGLLYLAHREGRLGQAELLTHAFHVADSYVCGVDPRPFLRLRTELAAGRPDGGRLTALFAPYAGPAERCVARWGLSRGPQPAGG
jgi:hypothetical protein